MKQATKYLNQQQLPKGRPSEFTGAGFSRTFIYGFWDGEMSFLEPMITKTFLESVKAMSGQSVTISIPQPQAFAETGYYPTHYRIRYDADRKFYFISLEGLTLRQATASL